MCHIQDQADLPLNEGREFNGSSDKCSRKWRTRAAVPWSLNGSKLLVEVALIPYPSGEVQLQRLPGTYPYPDTIPDIRIFRISRGEAQGSYAQLRLRAASEVTSQFDFETSRAWI